MQGKSRDKKVKTPELDIIRQLKPIVDEINRAVKDLDPAIKESMAQSLWNVALGNAPIGSVRPKVNEGHGQSGPEIGNETRQVDVSTRGGYVKHKNPQTSGQRVVAIAGFYLEEKQTDIVTVEQIAEGISELGEPVPDRVDNTIRNASYEGKKLFQKVGEGWKLNYAGQELLKKHMPMTEETSPKKAIRRKRTRRTAKTKDS